MIKKIVRKSIAYCIIMALISTMAIFAVPQSASAAGAVYYVDAVNGNDTAGDGSSGNPWKTISKAAGIMHAGDTCKIRTGIYRETVTPLNTGTEGAYITFEADTGAEVTISGADPVTGPWAVYNGDIYKTSKTLNMGAWKNEVFVDGVSMNLARWPNAGTDPMNPAFLSADAGTDNTKILDSELTQPDGYWNGAAVITMDKTRWSIASGNVTSYTKGRLNISNINTHGLGVAGDYGSPYYLIGKLAALDSANEWYYDEAAKALYLQTPYNDNPDSHTVEVKARTNGFNLKNKNYIRIKGLNLFACTIDASASNYCEIDGINGKYLSHYDFGHSGSEHFFKTSGILLGGTGNVLKNSTLAYSPGNLVTVSGQDSKIINNVMHDAAYGPAYTCSTGCIWVDGTSQLVSHNTLYNSARNCISGIMVDSRIQYNHGYNAMTLLDDGGAIYLTSVDGDGTEIHHNVFHDVKANPPYFISGGIYLDFMSWDFKIYNNLTYNTNKFGIFFHDYNEFLLAYNNTFYNDSVFRMKDDGGALDAYGVRVVNNISYEGVRLARGFGILEKNNFKEGDPQFINPDAGDFQLQTGSAAIDAGAVITGITDGYTGSAPDIGAFESGQPAWKAGHDFSSPPDPVFATANVQYDTLLENGFFERNVDTVGGWTKTHSGTAVIERSGNDAGSSRHAWTRGVKLGSGEDGVEQTVTGLKPNTEYELRGFGRTATGSQEIQLGVKDYGGDDKHESVTSTSWTRKKIKFTTGADQTSATVYIYKPTTGGFAYADDVTLMEVDPEAPPEFEFDDDPIIVEPGVTVINDRDLGTGLNQFEYVGNWATNPSNMDAYKGDVTFSNLANDYYQVRFDGEQIKMYTEMDAHFGIIAVSVDGGPETLVDLYSGTPKDQTLVYESPVLPSGQHIMKVRITGTKNASSSGTWIVSDRVEVLKTPVLKTVNDRETGTALYQFEYNGSWASNPSNMDAFKGDVTFSNTANDYYQIRFAGKQISIYTEKDTNMGIIGVSIDGGQETLVDLYSSESLDKTLVYTSPQLTSGQHIMKVRVTGTKNENSSGTWVVNDRVDIVLDDSGTPPEQEYGVLYTEDFESTPEGSMPDGWGASTDNPVRVTKDSSGNHILTLNETANGTTTAATYSFDPIQDRMGVDLRVMADQISKHANFLTLKDSSGVKVVELIFDLDYTHTGSHNIARRTPDNNWSNIMQYNANQWYQVHVDVDLLGGKYNIAIDGVEAASDIPVLNTASDVAQYTFSSYSWDSGTYHMDDLSIWGPIVEEEPELVEFVNENFESTALGTVPDGWTASADDPVSVTIDTTGNHILTATESGNGVTNSTGVTFDPIDKKAIVDLRVMAEQVGKTCNFLTLMDSTGAKVIELLFDQDYDHTGRHNFARRTADGNWSGLMQYNPGQWYQFHVEVDLEEGTYSVSIDGVGVGENIPVLSSSPVVSYSFSPHRWDTGTYHIDDLKITGFTTSSSQNTVPELAAVGDKTITEGQPLSFTLSAADAEGDTLTYSAANLPGGSAFDPATGTFVWTPAVGQAGSYAVTFSVTDGSLTDSMIVNITVNPAELEYETVLDEDFDSTAAGSVPAGWEIGTDGGSVGAAQLAGGENPANKALKVERKTMNTSNLYAKNVFNPVSGKVTIDLRMLNTKPNTLAYGPVIKGSSGKEAIYLAFQRNGTFGVINTAWQNLRAYAANQWYDIHIEADTDTDTYDLYIDGTLELNDKPFRNAVEDISEIRFSPYAWDNGVVYYDSIQIRTAKVNSNEAPVLDEIEDRTADEGQLLSFAVNAEDADGDVLAYSAENLPEGAVFDAATGVFTWIPGYEQSGAYSITFTVSDGSLSDSKTVNIVVNDVNRAPDLQPVNEITVYEGTALEFTVAAIDPDGDVLSYSVDNLPEGAQFSTTSGAITWTPGFEQAGEYIVDISVTDGTLISAANVKITVNDVKASELTAGMLAYIQGLDINSPAKKLLQNKLEDVVSRLDGEKYKQALVKMKVFMLEVKILEPRVINAEQEESILKSSLNILMAIKADAQGKDKGWVDKKLDEIINKMKEFKSGTVTDTTFDEVLNQIDQLINGVKE